MNKKIIVIIGGTLLVSCLFTNAMTKLQGEGKIINKQVSSHSYKDNYFIIPDSNMRYLTEDDLRGLSKDQLEIARNEIYARHGYAFEKKRWRNYFGSKSWYYRDNSCTQEVAKSRMNSVEKANLETIVDYEKHMGWR